MILGTKINTMLGDKKKNHWQQLLNLKPNNWFAVFNKYDQMERTRETDHSKTK
jgi:hypothetical protein